MADALAAPLVRLTVGDITKAGDQTVAAGTGASSPSRRWKDRHIPLLDIGTMDHIKGGRITVHGAIDHFTEAGVVFDDGTVLDVDAVVLGTGYRPALEDFLPEWKDVCDDDGRPLVSGGATSLPGLVLLRPIRLPIRDAARGRPRVTPNRRRHLDQLTTDVLVAAVGPCEMRVVTGVKDSRVAVLFGVGDAW